MRRDLEKTRRVALAPKTRMAGDAPFGGMNEEDRLAFIREGKAVKMKGRAVLRSLLKNVDKLANRLSHLVWEFEKGALNRTRIKAILQDSLQHLPAYEKHE